MTTSELVALISLKLRLFRETRRPADYPWHLIMQAMQRGR
jgi:hypothetical protein